MKRLINILLVLCTVGLAYACYWSISSETNFAAIKAEREQIVINRLQEIKSAEEQFKMIYGNYCGDIDSLIAFVKNERAVDHVIKDGELTDDQLEAGMTEREAVAQGLIKRDTVWVSAAEKLNIANPDSLKYVPVGKQGALIELRKDEMFNMKTNEMDILVEFRARLDDYLYGVDDKRVKNLKEDLKKKNKNRAELSESNTDDTEGTWYGLRMGDLKDTSNKMAGNWD
jgi:hypothetical protein